MSPPLNGCCLGRPHGQSANRIKVRTESELVKYVDLARRLGFAATSRLAVGTDAAEEAEKLCLEVGRAFPRTTYFAGRVLFRKERWYDRILLNETAFAIQKRLQWDNKTMVIVPARVG
jgi:hypothetical protein